MRELKPGDQIHGCVLVRRAENSNDALENWLAEENIGGGQLMLAFSRKEGEEAREALQAVIELRQSGAASSVLEAFQGLKLLRSHLDGETPALVFEQPGVPISSASPSEQSSFKNIAKVIGIIALSVATTLLVVTFFLGLAIQNFFKSLLEGYINQKI
jgi:hypothetical protein